MRKKPPKTFDDLFIQNFTLFLGVLFELITTDVHKPTPTSIAELMDKNFTFYFDDGFQNYMMNNHLMKIIYEYPEK